MQRSKVILMMLAPLLVSCGLDTKPSRTECIAGFKIDWSNVVTDRHDLQNLLGSRPIGDQRIEQLAAMVISSDGENLYLQFKENCEAKDVMSSRLIDFWRTEIPDLPQFVSMEVAIFPSPKTIDVTGPYWRTED